VNDGRFNGEIVLIFILRKCKIIAIHGAPSEAT